MRYLRLYKTFVAQHLKKLMEYRIDFLTGALSFLINQITNIVFIGIIFSQIPNLDGFLFYEIIFIYGFSFYHQHICVRACIYGQKITAPFNGVVSFILNNRRKFGRASDRGCEAVLMDYGLWISCICGVE